MEHYYGGTLLWWNILGCNIIMVEHYYGGTLGWWDKTVVRQQGGWNKMMVQLDGGTVGRFDSETGGQ